MSERTILITGNGFDLAHGLKTGYMDFVHRVEEAFAKPLERRSEFDIELTQLCNVNGFFRHFHFAMPEDETWNEFEAEMEVITQALEHFLFVIAEEQKSIEFDPASFNVYGGTFTYADLQVYKHFARIFEQVYDDPSGGLFKIRQTYLTQYKLLNKRAFLDEVYRELETFTEALDLYFTTCAGVNAVKRQPGRIVSLAPDYVVNFNYTDTAQLYGIPEDRIYYAKGRAGYANRAAALHPAAAHTNLVVGITDKSDSRTDWLRMQTDFQRLMNFVGDIPLSWLEGAVFGSADTVSPVEGAACKSADTVSAAEGAACKSADTASAAKGAVCKLATVTSAAKGADSELACAASAAEGGNSESAAAASVSAGTASALQIITHWYGYSFPQGDAEEIRQLAEASAKMIIYYVDPKDFAQKVLALVKIFGKKPVMAAMQNGKIQFETA